MAQAHPPQRPQPPGDRTPDGDAAPTTDEIERELGRRLRWLRRTRAMSQEAVAARCGVSFQQIQKYESASSRLSATMLWRLSVALGVEMDFFFHGLETTAARGKSVRVGEKLGRGAGR